MNIDFLPERIKVQRARYRRIRRQGHLLAGCVLALVLLGYVRQGRLSKAQAQVDILTERAANVQRQLSFRQGLEKQQAELLIMKRIEADLGSRVKVLDVLVELEKVVPETIALTHLSLETMEIPLSIETVYGGTAPKLATARLPRKKKILKRIRLMIRGLSPTDVDVANCIGQISASQLFEDVNMGYAKNVTFQDRKAREFEASCYIVR